MPVVASSVGKVLTSRSATLGAMVLLVTGQPTTAQDAGRIVLSERFHHARYRECEFSAYYYEEALRDGGRVELRCSQDRVPSIKDVYAIRRLTEQEAGQLKSLAGAADLYACGHTGTGPSSYGVIEYLWVRCCGRRDVAMRVTQGNSTFESGKRREFLNLLSRWRNALRKGIDKRRQTR